MLASKKVHNKQKANVRYYSSRTVSIDYRYKERGIEDGIVKHFEFQEGKKINATSF